MKRLFIAPVVFVLGCSLFTPKNAQTAVDFACLFGPAMEGKAPEIVLDLCEVLEKDRPIARYALSEQRMSMKRVGAAPACSSASPK
jgi:hypothetical protein